MLRRFLKLFGFLLLAAMVLMTVFLGQEHWQIRQIQTPLPSERTIHAMLAGSDTPIGMRIINTASQGIPQAASLAYPAFLIRWSDGRTLLIDVGMDRLQAAAFGQHLERLIGADPVLIHGSVGEQLGHEVASIEGIAFTHLHEDHTGGLGSLCVSAGQSIPVFQTPLQIDQQNHTTDFGHELISSTECARSNRLSGFGSLYDLPGFPGVAAFAAGGHTPGSTVFFVKIDSTIWVLAGDMTNDKKSIDENLPKPVLYSLLLTPEATGRLQKIRLWLAELDKAPDMSVVVSHDLEALQRLPFPIMHSQTGE